jgi:hypothetical protein
MVQAGVNDAGGAKARVPNSADAFTSYGCGAAEDDVVVKKGE